MAGTKKKKQRQKRSLKSVNNAFIENLQDVNNRLNSFLDGYFNIVEVNGQKTIMGRRAIAISEAQHEIIPTVLNKLGDPNVGKKYKPKAIQLLQKIINNLDIKYTNAENESVKLLLPSDEQRLLSMLEILNASNSDSSSRSSSRSSSSKRSSSSSSKRSSSSSSKSSSSKEEEEEPKMVVAKPIEKTLSEAAERNRQKQLAEKAQKLEAERIRNEEIMRRYNTSQEAKKQNAKEFKPMNFKPITIPPIIQSEWIDTGIFSVIEITSFIRNTNGLSRIYTDIPSTEFYVGAEPAYKNTVCNAMILISELSKKDATIILKGGKAAQVANSGLLNTMTKHASNDIDILLLPGTREKALKIANFVKFLLPNAADIGLLDKTDSGQPLIKLALTTPYMQAFLDIDYGTPIPEFYADIESVKLGSVFYRIQHPILYFEEKVFYYMLYQKKLKILNNLCDCGAPDGAYCMKECSYQHFTFNKFLGTMKAAITELQKSSYANPNLMEITKRKLQPLIKANL